MHPKIHIVSLYHYHGSNSRSGYDDKAEGTHPSLSYKLYANGSITDDRDIVQFSGRAVRSLCRKNTMIRNGQQPFLLNMNRNVLKISLISTQTLLSIMYLRSISIHSSNEILLRFLVACQ